MMAIIRGPFPEQEQWIERYADLIKCNLPYRESVQLSLKDIERWVRWVFGHEQWTLYIEPGRPEMLVDMGTGESFTYSPVPKVRAEIGERYFAVNEYDLLKSEE